MKLNLKALEDNQAGDFDPARLNVLLIDDEEHNLYGLKVHLADKYNVFTCLSGPEALELIEKEKETEFAAIISDHIMPSMTGVEFFTRLNQLNHPAFRILLTGYAGLDNVVAAINEASIYRYLRKPVDTHEITSVISEAVNHYKEEQENIHLVDQMRKQLYLHQLKKSAH